MSWTNHIDTICSKINQRLGVLKHVKSLSPRHARITLYNSLICPLFDWTFLCVCPTTDALNLLGWKTLDKRRMFHRVVMAFKFLNVNLDFDFGTKSKKDFHGPVTTPEEK